VYVGQACLARTYRNALQFLARAWSKEQHAFTDREGASARFHGRSTYAPEVIGTPFALLWATSLSLAPSAVMHAFWTRGNALLTNLLLVAAVMAMLTTCTGGKFCLSPEVVTETGGSAGTPLGLARTDPGLVCRFHHRSKAARSSH
jgi:hypothetical protein